MREEEKGTVQDEFERKVIKACNIYSLTRREEEVYSYLVRGRSLSYIASELIVSEHTVRTHIRHVYEKTDIHSKQDLINQFEAL